MNSPLMSSEECSPHSKRHSFPAILSYSETLSVLSEHQRQYNDREIIRGCNTPILDSSGTEEERKQKLQQAMEWLKVELKDMYHQDKFILRQFNHLNRTIQELKEKKELKEAAEAKEAKQFEEESFRQIQTKKERLKNQRVQKKEVEYIKDPPTNEVGQQDLKQEKRSLNEYDSDYGSDQSMDRFEDDCQVFKDNVIFNGSPKMIAKQRSAKRWTWWK